jgi:hypothetical protein
MKRFLAKSARRPLGMGEFYNDLSRITVLSGDIAH